MNTSKNNIIIANDYQKNLFKEIVNMKYRIQSLAEYVQNDFEKMLIDGIINKHDIAKSIDDMDKSFNETIKEINKLHEKCKLLMTYYII